MSTSGKPNFFIVGAPKCGTTALAEYLREHPQVFVSSPKEPFYFSSDVTPNVRWTPRSLKDYLKLFERATQQHLAVGEASTSYLYSSVAVERIREFNPEARVIAVVRNPIEMAHSLHSHNYHRFRDDVADFREAWELQALRRRGERIPRTNRSPAFLQYESVCKLGEQIERLKNTLPPEQLHIIVFDDFAESARAVYERLLEFLGVPSDERESFPVVNPNVEHTSRFWAKIDFSLRELANYRLLRQAVSSVKERLSLSGIRILGVPQSRYARSSKRQPLDPNFRAELAETFRSDVMKLGRLIDRDLRHWLEFYGNQ